MGGEIRDRAWLWSDILYLLRAVLQFIGMGHPILEALVKLTGLGFGIALDPLEQFRVAT